MPNLTRLKDEVENGVQNVRATMTRLAITGQYHDGQSECVTFIKGRKGIEIKWNGHITVDAIETQRCSMGHEHQIKKDKHWVWNYCRLTRADVARLVEFLSEH